MEDNLRRNGMMSDSTVDASYFVGRRGRLLTICSFIVTSLHIFGITFKKRVGCLGAYRILFMTW